MNKQRRSTIKTAMLHIEKAVELIQDVKYEEQDALDNMPENLQNSERYEAMENAIDSLEDALDGIEDVKDCLDRAVA